MDTPLDYINPGRAIQMDSSSLYTVQYDWETQALDVFFKGRDGGISGHYRYFEVLPEDVCRFVFASSQGEEFNVAIKKGYTFVKIA